MSTTPALISRPPSPLAESPDHEFRVAKKDRLVRRVSFAIGLIGTGLAVAFAVASAPYIHNYETKRHLAQIDDLLAAVENTARIACFTGDQTLAQDVAQGLAANPAVTSVRITARGLALVDTASATGNTGPTETVSRSLASPFDQRQPVGDITLAINGKYVSQQANRYWWLFGGLLILEVIAVTLLVALVTLRQVVRPITQLALDLQLIEGRGNQYLRPPRGHETSEIGHLTHSFNRLIANAAGLLDCQQDMANEIALSERRYRALVENSPDIVARFTADGHLIFANPACTRLAGLSTSWLSPDAPIPATAWRANMPLDHFLGRVRSVASTGTSDTLIWEWETPAGPICHEIHMVAEYDVDEAPIGVLAIGRDVSARQSAERKLLHQATHDALTGLPNRALLRDRLQHAIAHARREGRHGAIVFIDIDHFKEINDSLGHDAGDQFLCLLAERMRHILREADTVARLGGDEFVVLLEDTRNNPAIDAVAQKLADAISLPCDLAGNRFYPTASMGIAVFPDDGNDADTLMRNADTAMYVAKDSGRHCYRYFSPEMNAELTEWIELTGSLRQAIENREFELYYQPKACLENGEFAGMEALIRWRHPTRGLMSPGAFVPAAERSGLIGEIGAWVMDQACWQARAWLDAGLNPRRVAVNLSASQCRDGKLAQTVRHTLTEHRLPGRHLEVEITESIVMDDAEESIKALWALRDLEVQIAVDDFGTGYSSLGYLKRLPVDKLKIDKAFIDDIESDQDDLAIIKAIIAMAHSMDLTVVAEGVETIRQIECLRNAGCDHMQGYYYGRPMPAAAMTEFLSGGVWLPLPIRTPHTD